MTDRADVKRTVRAFSRDNLEAARIILADPATYPPDGAMAEYARRVVEKESEES